MTPDETALVVYFSGHGVPGRLDGGAYLLPVDADPEDPVATGYPVADLYASLLALAPRSLVVILEAGFAADSFAGAVLQSPAAPREDALAPPPGAPVTLLAATRGDEIANWDEQAQLGLFTRFLLLGLDGGADTGRLGDGDGRVTLAELDGWLAEELGFAARRRFGRNQRATVVGDPGAVLAQRMGDAWPPRPSLGELRAAADALARSPDAAPPAEPEPVLAVPDQPAGAEPGR